MAWLIVLSDAVAARWVLKNETMAFRTSALVHTPSPGDSFAIYISRSAHRNPNRDEAQIVAVGTIASDVRKHRVNVAGKTYASTCALSIDMQLPLREGVAFRPLVDSLSFIRLKDSWASYVRRTIIELPESDFERIRRAVVKAAVPARVASA